MEIPLFSGCRGATGPFHSNFHILKDCFGRNLIPQMLDGARSHGAFLVFASFIRGDELVSVILFTESYLDTHQSFRHQCF